MDLRKLKTLIDLVSESAISELEITEAEGKVRIVKAPVAQPVAKVRIVKAPVAQPVAAALPPAGPAGAAAPAAVAAVATAIAPPAEQEVKLIRSPMVGTFYRSASPGASAFVDVGSEIKAGEPVCIIEAMKIMNEVESDVDGRIAKILVSNGQAVEFGQPLFVLE
jgi:acetyl-CoA carboxylase biotin carboxyl carrier protein